MPNNSSQQTLRVRNMWSWCFDVTDRLIPLKALLASTSFGVLIFKNFSNSPLIHSLRSKNLTWSLDFEDLNGFCNNAGITNKDFNAMFTSGDLLFHLLMSRVDSSTYLLPAAPVGMLKKLLFHLVNSLYKALNIWARSIDVWLSNRHGRSGDKIGKMTSCQQSKEYFFFAW